MAGLLFGVKPLDPLPYLLSALLLLAVACSACLIPALGAAATDPAEVLRAE
jgi:ABC-type lipoprotein release transport system permease subunit